MKRALTQKDLPLPSTTGNSGVIVGQGSSSSWSNDRRTRTSAAMIGLAISMGASSLLLPRQGDSAVAAEPTKSESAVASLPASFNVASLPVTNRVEATTVAFSQPASSSRSVRHTVQEGQTLWKLAQIYQVDAAAIAASNGLAAGSVLKVGQTLTIPSNSGIVHEPSSNPTVASSQVRNAEPTKVALAPSGSETSEQSSSQSVHELLKAKQKDSASRLQEKRDNLESSLSQLSGETDAQVTEESADSFEVAKANLSSEPLRELEFSAPDGNVEANVNDSRESSSSTRIGDSIAKLPSPESAVRPPALEPLPASPNSPQVESQSSNDVPSLSEEDNPAKVTASEESLKVATTSIPLTPDASEVLEEASQSSLYKVQQGDTLAEIARRHNVSVADLVKANNIGNPNLIFPNQALRLPQAVATSNSDVPNLVKSTLTASTAVPNRDWVASTSSQADATTDEVPSLPDLSAEKNSSQLVAASGINAPKGNSQSISLPELPNTVRSEDSGRLAYSNYAASLRQQLSASSETTEIAAAPSTVDNRLTGLQNSAAQPAAQLDYVQNLRKEVLRMQKQYRDRGTEASATQSSSRSSVQREASSTQALSALPSSQINPEFNPQRHSEALNREEVTIPLQSSKVDSNSAESVVAPVKSPQLMAAAPTPPEAYQSLAQPSLLGQTVSPDLPPLGSANDYLPGSAAFEGYIWPAKGVLTSGYGWRWGRMHKGVDIAAPVGTPIVAAAPGVVVTSGWNSGGYGNLVVIQHPDGSRTLYAHNSRLLVRKGQEVEQGQQIAAMGSTGFSTGPHLHFEVHPSGKGATNPMAFLPNRRG